MDIHFGLPVLVWYRESIDYGDGFVSVPQKVGEGSIMKSMHIVCPFTSEHRSAENHPNRNAYQWGAKLSTHEL